METAKAIFHSKQIGLAVLLVLILVIGYFFAFRHMRFFLVPSKSMEPTLLVSDYLMTLNESEYERGDIVVAHDNEYGGYLVKRIVGVAGDRVEVRNGGLFINGEYASEPYIAEPIEYTLEPIEVPAGEVLLLGDNRNWSDDAHLSRKTERVEEIVGSVRLIYYPYDRFGPVQHFPLTNALGK